LFGFVGRVSGMSSFEGSSDSQYLVNFAFISFIFCHSTSLNHDYWNILQLAEIFVLSSLFCLLSKKNCCLSVSCSAPSILSLLLRIRFGFFVSLKL
jgi:hypothetical protein